MASGRRPLLVVVTGPTASGKTSLAIELARHYHTDIISADSRQIYSDIPIGTAAPTPQERSRAFHHLVGTLPVDGYYSAARFAQDATVILNDIWRRTPVAIVCGGSMMYVDALTGSIDDMPTITGSVRRYVLDMLASGGPEAVMAQLEVLDPDYAAVVDRANTRRVVHAVEICLQAGVPYSTLRTGTRRELPFDVIKLAIDRTREDLFARINARVDTMISEGLEAEATALLTPYVNRPEALPNALNTVGYKEILATMRGQMDRDTAIARIAKNTRVYAKKQLTWLRRDTTIHWLPPASALSDAIALITEHLTGIAGDAKND